MTAAKILRRSLLSGLAALGMLTHAVPASDVLYESTQSIDQFWSDENIADAIPLDESASGPQMAAAASSTSSPAAAASVTTTPSPGSSETPTEAPSAPSSVEVAAAAQVAPVAAARVANVAAQPAAIATVNPLPDKVAPQPGQGVNFPGIPQIGTFFFTNEAGTTKHRCTGTVMTSQSRSIVLTAAHCFHRQDPARFVFIPQWSMAGGQSVEPFGRFFLAAGGIYTYPEYTDANAQAHLDLALLRIAPRNGTPIGNIVGSYPVHFDASTVQSRVFIYGYPASGADGASVTAARQCYNETPSSMGADSRPTLSFSMVIGCTGYPGGVSGGPWVVTTITGPIIIAITAGEVVPVTSSRTTIGLKFNDNLRTLLARAGSDSNVGPAT